MLNSRNLNISYLGGMNSYTLTLIVSAFLTTKPEISCPAQCLMETLKFIGTEFDSNNMIIVGDDVVEVKDAFNLYVEDPFRPGVNVARNVRRFKEIKEVIGNCYDTLISSYKEWGEIEGKHNTGNTLNKLITVINS